MTKEQEEAIEMLEDIENNTWTTKYIMSSDSKKAETVLNMLKEKDTELKKKDKIIDLMAAFIDEISEYYTKIEGKNNDFCDEKCIDKNIDCRDCIKQYFERKVKHEN